MPRIKKAIQRMHVITQTIMNNPVTKDQIKEAVERRIGDRVCNSTIEKDLFILKMEFDAPIECNRSSKLYYYTEPYSFTAAMIAWMDV
jgi:hypothetical protein